MAYLWMLFCNLRQLYIDLFTDTYISNVRHLNRCYAKPAAPGGDYARRQDHDR